MESIIATMFERYESGAVTRRQLIQGLAALATAATAKPAEAQGFAVTAIDHIQINANHAQRSAQWYEKVLGLKPIRAGAMSDESEEIAHVGSGDTLLVSFRKLQPVGRVDHIGFRVLGANQESIVKDLKARGAAYGPAPAGGPPGNYLVDPDGIRIQLGGKTATKPY